MKTYMKADTKLSIIMCSQIFEMKSTALFSNNVCRLADLD